ncbi:hypothetical protein [Granulicella sp. dw_53]|uniref:hypothetical protein n=1 Tax=Granulicella sp. dw_53 TaxID=2719792 RepID=UPI001BD260C3|nr:hypothetical protein [Granulicella sp. dw_53]
MQNDHRSDEAHVIQLPAPTAWPMILALGVSLILAGMVTHLVVGLLGLVLTVAGGLGWFFQVLPHEAHESVAVRTEEVQIVSRRTLSEREALAVTHRKILPVETFHITTGIKGGIAGGIAMTIPAALFSILRYHSIWYAMNLLAAGGFISWAGASDAFLSEFHLQGFLAALAIHGLTSLLVGLLYGAMLPMFPRYPILTAGFISPLLFTGILHSALNILSPILNQRIDWFWFVLSQIAFGLVCGFVVNLQVKVRTPQFQALPFAIRAGIHSDLTERTYDEARHSDERDSPK